MASGLSASDEKLMCKTHISAITYDAAEKIPEKDVNIHEQELDIFQKDCSNQNKMQQKKFSTVNEHVPVEQSCHCLKMWREH